MKIFVTGGTGFIGSHFLNQAHSAGFEVVAHRLSRPSQTRIPLLREPVWLDCPLDQIEAMHLQGCDAVVHLAAHTPNVPYDSYFNCHYWNVLVPVRLFEKALEAGVLRWVVAGSCFEYGSSGERYDFIPVSAPLEPTGSYPTSKAAASIALAGLSRANRASLFLGRIFQVFGEGELESRLWPSLKKAALAGEDFPMSPGEQIRDFIPVEQVAKAFLCALALPSSSFILHPSSLSSPLVANIGTGHPQSIRAFAEHWWKKWGATGKLLPGALPYRDNEVMRYVPEVSPLFLPV